MRLRPWYVLLLLSGSGCVHARRDASALADAAQPQPPSAAVVQLKSDLLGTALTVDAQLHPPGPDCTQPLAQACTYDQNLQLSHILDGAYLLLLLQDDPELQARFGLNAAGAIQKAECWLACALQLQDLSGVATASPSATYGKFAWDVRRTVTDDNAVEFAAEGLSRIAAQFPADLGAAFVGTVLAPHLAATLLGLQRHVGPYGTANRAPVAPSYTNIYLGNIVAQILLSAAVNNAAAQASAEASLEAWLAAVQANGIEEYDSPYYYQLDLSALEMGYLLAPVKQPFATALDYFWTDIAANTFSGMLSGSHSRNYDFLRSTSGGVALDLYVEGLRSAQRTGGVDLSKVFVIAPRLMAAAHRPSAGILALAQELPRWIRSRVGGPSAEDPTGPVGRSNYVTSAFAIGSSSQDYAKQVVGAHGLKTGYMDQDRIFAFQFRSDLAPPLPDISINVNTSPAAVYGAATADPSGHVKTHHVAPVYPTIVQAQDAVLVLLNLDPSASGKPVAEFTTNLILPFKLSAATNGDQLVFLDAHDVWQPVALQPPATPSAPGVAVAVPRLAVVAGWSSASGACFAARFFHVDTAAGTVPAAAWFAVWADDISANDTNGTQREFGWKQGALRLALSQFQASGPPQLLTDQHLLVGFAFKAEVCATAAAFGALEAEIQQVQITETLPGAIWSAAAVWPTGLKLFAATNVAARTVSGRSVNDVPVAAPQGINVNGRDLVP